MDMEDAREAIYGMPTLNESIFGGAPEQLAALETSETNNLASHGGQWRFIQRL